MFLDTVRIAPAAPPALVDEPSAGEIFAALGFDTGEAPRAEAEVVVEDTATPTDPLAAAFQSAVADIVSNIPVSAIASRKARDAVAEVLGDAAKSLQDNLEAKLTFYQGEPLDVELPITVDLEVVQAEVAVKGDTATGLTKKVVTETGLEVTVPAFVNRGDIIRVDTRTGEYVTRVS